MPQAYSVIVDARYGSPSREPVTTSTWSDCDRNHNGSVSRTSCSSSGSFRADLFVLPTHQENWGFVLLEALACGTALLTTKSVDIWPELESSGGAIILDRSGEAIADAVQPLLETPDRMTSMGEQGREWVLREQNADRVAGLYEQLYS